MYKVFFQFFFFNPGNGFFIKFVHIKKRSLYLDPKKSIDHISFTIFL